MTHDVDLVAKVKYAVLSLFNGETMKIKNVVKLLLLVSLVSSLSLITPTPAKASFDPSQAAYYEEVKTVLSLTPEQEEMLENYGFAVVELSNTSTAPHSLF